MSDESPEATPGARLPTGVPMIYADHLMDAIYGFHTTKLILGIEDGKIGRTGLRPSAVVTMPTPLLLAAAARLVRDLTSPDVITETTARYSSILEELHSLASAFRAQESAAVKQSPSEPGVTHATAD